MDVILKTFYAGWKWETFIPFASNFELLWLSGSAAKFALNALKTKRCLR